MFSVIINDDGSCAVRFDASDRGQSFWAADADTQSDHGDAWWAALRAAVEAEIEL